jgi:hypothetical protein
MIEVISRVVMTGSCDQCGKAAPLYMTQDECGHQALLCRHCIEKATKTEKKGS